MTFHFFLDDILKMKICICKFSWENFAIFDIFLIFSIKDSCPIGSFDF